MQSKKHQNKIYRWLMTGCFLIVLMVVVCGITRLTESGLSMTNWKPVTGFLPPLSPEAWQEEFNDYQNSPESKQIIHYKVKTE